MDTHQSALHTELRGRLLAANVEAVASASGLSTKTIYRIRRGENGDIALSTWERITVALNQIEQADRINRALSAKHEAKVAA